MSIQCSTFTRVLRLRLKDKHARALREHAYWVNQVWNYCNDLSSKVLKREHRFLSGFDLQKYTAGATREGLPLHSQSVQAIAEEYALRRKQFKRLAAIQAKIRNRRKEALHQFTSALVKDYGAIFIGDVSTAWQTATGNGKSVLDASWGQLKTQLQYKSERAGRWVEVIDEAHSTQTCTMCGERSGPKGREGLADREWTCFHCGALHD